MNKQEFILNLRQKLSGLPTREVEERLAFYSEMIDDRVEEGLTEEDAVAEIGSVDEVASQIIADIPLVKIAKEKIKPKRRMRAWELVLLAVGSPVWLSLAIAALAVIFSLYVAFWSVIASLWAVFGALAGCAFGAVIAGAVLTLGNVPLVGLATVAAGIFCAGASILWFLGCKWLTGEILLLTKKVALWIKKLLTGKGEEL